MKRSPIVVMRSRSLIIGCEHLTYKGRQLYSLLFVNIACCVGVEAAKRISDDILGVRAWGGNMSISNEGSEYYVWTTTTDR